LGQLAVHRYTDFEDVKSVITRKPVCCAATFTGNIAKRAASSGQADFRTNLRAALNALENIGTSFQWTSY
jgi:hypothetical protein